VGVIASHAILPFGKISWRSKALLSVSAAIVAGGVVFGFVPLRRPFDLQRANLSNQWLQGDNLGGAVLTFANLSNADLSNADLSGADLSYADLYFANLSGANLIGAALAEARELNKACGNVNTKLPEGFTVKPCPEKR
jgi:uncharacterized protein YjbI with pentapeptide repeats